MKEFKYRSFSPLSLKFIILSPIVKMLKIIRIVTITALAGVTQWIERQPLDQKVAGSVPGQGMCLGCGPGLQLGMCERQPIDVSLAHRCFSPSLSPSLPCSLKINK